MKYVLNVFKISYAAGIFCVIIAPLSKESQAVRVRYPACKTLKPKEKKMKHLRSTIEEYKVLLRSVPSMVIAVFILSVVLMNLLAGREL